MIYGERLCCDEYAIAAFVKKYKKNEVR